MIIIFYLFYFCFLWLNYFLLFKTLRTILRLIIFKFIIIIFFNVRFNLFINWFFFESYLFNLSFLFYNRLGWRNFIFINWRIFVTNIDRLKTNIITWVPIFRLFIELKILMWVSCKLFLSYSFFDLIAYFSFSLILIDSHII